MSKERSTHAATSFAVFGDVSPVSSTTTEEARGPPPGDAGGDAEAEGPGEPNSPRMRAPDEPSRESVDASGGAGGGGWWEEKEPFPPLPLLPGGFGGFELCGRRRSADCGGINEEETDTAEEEWVDRGEPGAEGGAGACGCCGWVRGYALASERSQHCEKPCCSA